FFFQAEDGIRDFHVTGVQTCALPISRPAFADGAGPGRIAVDARRLRRGHGSTTHALHGPAAWAATGGHAHAHGPPGRARALDPRPEERRVGKERRTPGWGRTSKKDE